MRALVTGGAGFIGSNLVDALLDDGASVDVVDNLSTGRLSNLDDALARGARLHEVDITDAEALTAVFQQASPEVVFHLAAQIDVRKSVDDPAFDATVNVVGTINVLDAAHQAGAVRVVNTSTGGAIYGDASRIPTPESEQALPMAAYGQSKYCAERYLGWFDRLHGMHGATLRLGNVYGPRQDPLGEAGVIAIFCGRIASGEAPLIFGDGTQTRDYVFVGDVVAAQLAAARSQATGEINIGTGIETSVLDLVAAFHQIVPGSVDTFVPQFAEPRAGEVQRSALAVDKAREQLGWSAVTSLVDGMRVTLESES